MQIKNMQLVRDKGRVDSIAGVGPADYLTGAKPTITLGNLRNIDSIDDVHVETDGYVYKPKVSLISGNVVTLTWAEGAVGADAEVADHTDLHLVNFFVSARGM